MSASNSSQLSGQAPPPAGQAQQQPLGQLNGSPGSSRSTGAAPASQEDDSMAGRARQDSVQDENTPVPQRGLNGGFIGGARRRSTSEETELDTPSRTKNTKTSYLVDPATGRRTEELDGQDIVRRNGASFRRF